MRRITRARGAWVLASALTLSACGGGGGTTVEVASRPPLPPADYLTQSDQFAELQRAALAADYETFARHLGAGGEVVGQLRDAFGGGPFDVYTLQASTGSRDHRRVAELRGPNARLYLYVELDRAAGGWNLDRYELGRDRSGALARL